jgi:hypothetical protein
VEQTVRARRWRVAIGVGVLALLASGCVTDLTARYGDRALMQAINDRGFMVGYSGDTMQLARFEPGGGRTVLDPIDGEGVTFGSINNANEIVGTVNGQDTLPGPKYPVAWDGDGHAIDLRPMIPHAGEPEVTIYDIDLNENGVLLGKMSGTGVPEQLFTVNIRTGAFTALPRDADSYYVSASAMNDAGVVVGVEGGPNGSQPKRWTRHGDSYIGEPLPDGFEAADINNAGDMVGRTRNLSGLVVWKAGAPGYVALSAPPEPEYPWYAMLSAQITDTGMVAAWAFTPGAATAVRWRAFDAAPEVMPRDTWQSIVLMDINEQGAAVISAFRDDVRHSLQWTIDA